MYDEFSNQQVDSALFVKMVTSLKAEGSYAPLSKADYQAFVARIIKAFYENFSDEEKTQFCIYFSSLLGGFFV